MENVECCAHGSLFMISHISTRPPAPDTLHCCWTLQAQKILPHYSMCLCVRFSSSLDTLAHPHNLRFTWEEAIAFYTTCLFCNAIFSLVLAALRQTFSASFVNLHFYGFNMFT